MKLKKFLKIMDPLIRCKIYTSDQPDDDEVPEFQGWLMDIPWYLTEYEIGMSENYSSSYEPICFYDHIDDEGHPGLVINLIAE